MTKTKTTKTKGPEEKYYPRSFRLDAQMKADLDECAEILGKTTDTQVLRDALRNYVRKLRRERENER